MSNELLVTLGQLLSGMAPTQAQYAEARPMPFPMVEAQKGHRPMPPMVLPPNGPIPQPRPELPNGTFTPNRQQMPHQGPTPTPRPNMMPPVQTAPPAMGTMVQQPVQQNPLAALFGGGSAGGDWRKMLQSAGAGMAAIDPRNDDPFATFGNSLTSSMGYYDAETEKARQQALEENKRAYDRSQDALGNSRSDAELELRRAAEARAAKSSDLLNKKTAAEIERDAKANGLTVSQQLEIERVAQAAGEGYVDPDERKKAIEEKRQQLIDQFTGGRGISGQSGLTGQGGLSAMQTATNPDTGEKVKYDPATQQWVPMK